MERKSIDWDEVEAYLAKQQGLEQDEEVELILPPKETEQREKRLRRNAFEKTMRRQAKKMFELYGDLRRLLDARRRGRLGK